MAIVFIESCYQGNKTLVYSETITTRNGENYHAIKGTMVHSKNGIVLTRSKICIISDLLRTQLDPKDKSLLICSSDGYIESNYNRVKKKLSDGQPINKRNAMERACEVLFQIINDKNVEIQFDTDYISRRVIIDSARIYADVLNRAEQRTPAFLG